MGWAGAAIGAVGTLGGSIVQSRAQNKATQASERSTQAALAFEREREQARRAEYDKAMAAYEKRMAAYEQNRNALLGRYGVSVGAPTSPGMPVRGASTPLPSAPSAPMAGAPGIQPSPQGSGPFNIRSMIGPRDLSAWNSWEQQGLA